MKEALKEYNASNLDILKYFHEEDICDLYNRRKVNKLYEGLIKSYNYNSTIKLIQKKFKINQIVYKNNKIRIYIRKSYKLYNKTMNMFLNDFKEFNKLLNVCGWDISTFQYVDKKLNLFKYSELDKIINNKEIIQITCLLEPKYQFEYFDIKDNLFHISHIKNRNKILKKGLIPKSQSRINHPDRVYCFYNKVDFEEYSKKLYKFSKIKKKVFDIFKIDVNNLKNKWIKDINFNNAVYTLENISPYHITHLKTIKL
jgi:hypothetical protein